MDPLDQQPLSGARVRAIARILPLQGFSTDSPVLRRHADTIVSTAGHPELRQWSFDHVITLEDGAVTLLRTLKPCIMPLFNGQASSILSARSCFIPSPLFFDRQSKISGLLSVLEFILDEAKKRQQSVYVSFGAVDQNYRTVVDLLGGASGSEARYGLLLSPSLHDGSLLPQIREEYVANSKELATISRTAMQRLQEEEDRCHLSLDCVLFATVLIHAAVPLSRGRHALAPTRLNIIELGSSAQIDGLALSSAEQLHPLLGSDRQEFALPLLFYGVAMRNLCTVVVTVAERLISKPPFDAHHRRFRTDASLLDACSRLRRVVTVATTASHHVGVPDIEPEQLALWKASCDVLQLHQRLVEAPNDIEQRTELQRLSHLLNLERESVKALRQQLSRRIPSMLEVIGGSGMYSAVLLQNRVHQIEEIESEQRHQFEVLDQYRQWLLKLPVVGQISDAVRCAVLEKSVEALSEENTRLRARYTRDVQALQNENQILRLMKTFGGDAGTKATALSTLRGPIDGFLEEAPQYLRGGRKGELNALIDDLCSTLKGRIDVATIETEESDSAAPTEANRAAYRSLFLAAVEQLSGDLGVSVKCPNELDDGPESQLGWWQELIFSRLAYRQDSIRLRSHASALASHVDRVIALLQELAAEASKTLAESQSTATRRATSPRRSKRITADDLIAEEYCATPLPKPHAETTAQLLLTIERCRTVCEGLRCLSLGCSAKRTLGDSAELLSSPTMQAEPSPPPRVGNEARREKEVQASPPVLHVTLENMLQRYADTRADTRRKEAIRVPKGYFSRTLSPHMAVRDL
jgi:hypothetical protein